MRPGAVTPKLTSVHLPLCFRLRRLLASIVGLPTCLPTCLHICPSTCPRTCPNASLPCGSALCRCIKIHGLDATSVPLRECAKHAKHNAPRNPSSVRPPPSSVVDSVRVAAATIINAVVAICFFGVAAAVGRCCRCCHGRCGRRYQRHFLLFFIGIGLCYRSRPYRTTGVQRGWQ